MTKLEEFARAIAGQPEGDLDDRWMNKARRGLRVLRDPTDAMCLDGRERNAEQYQDNAGFDEAVIWRGMIDSILRDAP